MTSHFFSARLFSLLFGLGYAAAVYVNYPLFRYYPLVSRFSMRDLADPSLGPAMSWFGWIAIAALPAAVLTALIPKKLGDRIPGGVTWWILVAVMMFAAWVRERDWFLH